MKKNQFMNVLVEKSSWLMKFRKKSENQKNQNFELGKFSKSQII